MTLTARVLTTMQRFDMLAAGRRVVIALSGGADSVALLFLLRELEQDGALHVAGVAHLNHQLRGAEADADEAFCAALAARLGVAFRAERTDVAALARKEKRSVEDVARSARYAFFDRVADDLPADVIAVAHTREDQAETFLLRLLRGAGTRGLAAIQPRAGRVVRPVLDIERAALREYLAGRGEAFREDSSNADVSIPRNRIRHEVIPYLQSHFSPGVSGVLARDAALARQDEEFLREQAIKLASRIVLSDDASGSGRTPREIRLDTAGLLDAPRALSSRVVQMALEQHAGSKPISFDHVEQVLALAADDTSLPRRSRGAAKAGTVSLPGQYAVRAGGTIVLRPGRGRPDAVANAFAFSLSIPGEVELGPQGIAVGAERLSGTKAGAARPMMQWTGRGAEVGVAAGAVELPLAVRSRRPGDRFRPLGAPGGRKLQDFLVDRKVARDERDLLPLVVDGRDRIVWVVGQAVAEDFRVMDPSQGVLLLKVRRF